MSEDKVPSMNENMVTARLIAELDDLNGKIARLHDYICAHPTSDDGGMESEELALMHRQYRAMRDYKQYLAKRISLRRGEKGSDA